MTNFLQPRIRGTHASLDWKLIFPEKHLWQKDEKYADDTSDKERKGWVRGVKELLNGRITSPVHSDAVSRMKHTKIFEIFSLVDQSGSVKTKYDKSAAFNDACQTETSTPKGTEKICYSFATCAISSIQYRN